MNSNDKPTISEEIESLDQGRISDEQAESELDDQVQGSKTDSAVPQETQMGSVKSTATEVSRARPSRSGIAELRHRMLSRPDEGYLAFVQLLDTIDIPPTASKEVIEQLQEDTVDLYAAFNPRDPVESLLARQLVALGNASMGCYRRASRNSGARDIELRHGIKASSIVFEGVKTLDERRGRNQKIVNVGQVKVESGAQAIVGNVASPERQAHMTMSPTSAISDDAIDGKDN